jgi:hypothetical protein
MKRDWNMPGHARYIYDRPRALLLHHGNHSLHGFDRPEEIGFKGLATGGHTHVRDGIQYSVAGVINPYVDALEVVEGEADDAINLLAITYVAGEPQGPFAVEDTPAGRLSPLGVA